MQDRALLSARQTQAGDGLLVASAPPTVPTKASSINGWRLQPLDNIPSLVAGDLNMDVEWLLAVAGGFIAGAVVAWLSEPGRQFMGFAAESWGEVKKVVWPTRKETIQTTAAVFAFVVVMAIFLWITDKALEWVLYDLLLRRT